MKIYWGHIAKTRIAIVNRDPNQGYFTNISGSPRGRTAAAPSLEHTRPAAAFVLGTPATMSKHAPVLRELA
jgi:hypothetical protein